MAHRLQLLNRELELVEELGIQQQVLRPDIRLILRQEVAQFEMRGNGRVGVRLSHLDESGRVGVCRSLRCPAALEWPAAEEVSADVSAAFFGERDERDDVEVVELAHGLIHLHGHFVNAGLLGRGEVGRNFVRAFRKHRFRAARRSRRDRCSRRGGGEVDVSAVAAKRIEKAEHGVVDVRGRWRIGMEDLRGHRRRRGRRQLDAGFPRFALHLALLLIRGANGADPSGDVEEHDHDGDPREDVFLPFVETAENAVPCLRLREKVRRLRLCHEPPRFTTHAVGREWGVGSRNWELRTA